MAPPLISGRECIKTLGRMGYVWIRTRGSHAVLRHQDGRTTVVPLHSRETIGPGLLRAILRDVEMSVENFQKLC